MKRKRSGFAIDGFGPPEAAEDSFGVGTKWASSVTHRAWSLRQMRDDILHGHPAGPGDNPAGKIVLVLEDVAHIEDGRDRRIDAAKLAGKIAFRAPI